MQLQLIPAACVPCVFGDMLGFGVSAAYVKPTCWLEERRRSSTRFVQYVNTGYISKCLCVSDVLGN